MVTACSSPVKPDVNVDGNVSPLDALLVINRLNDRPIPVGEPAPVPGPTLSARDVDELFSDAEDEEDLLDDDLAGVLGAAWH